MSNRQTLARGNAHRLQSRPAFACIALVLQGGGALGAYQAGVYEALAESSLPPDWVAGISIGAINAALIAGNAPDTRIEKLRTFWEGITAWPFWRREAQLGATLLRGDAARQWHNQISAGLAFMGGAPGFFSPRLLLPWLNPSATLEAMSLVDTSRLKRTLEQLIDFDRFNIAETRFSVGAVNVNSGNSVYFDNRTHRIAAKHVMASGAESHSPPWRLSASTAVDLMLALPLQHCSDVRAPMEGAAPAHDRDFNAPSTDHTNNGRGDKGAAMV